MLNLSKSIEKLMKFLIKAITKAIETANKMIEIHYESENKIERLKLIIGKLSEIKKELEEE